MQGWGGSAAVGGDVEVEIGAGFFAGAASGGCLGSRGVERGRFLAGTKQGNRRRPETFGAIGVGAGGPVVPREQVLGLRTHASSIIMEIARRVLSCRMAGRPTIGSHPNDQKIE